MSTRAAPALISMTITALSVLVRRGHPDLISFTFGGPSVFPITGDQPSATIPAQHGTGVEWCRRFFAMEPEVINAG